MTGPAALVWFKRDLRVHDHAALAVAMHFEGTLGLVVMESQRLDGPECDPRHVGFMLDCLAELHAIGRRLACRCSFAPVGCHRCCKHCGASSLSPWCRPWHAARVWIPPPWAAEETFCRLTRFVRPPWLAMAHGPRPPVGSRRAKGGHWLENLGP
jgi:hypothetical protein